MNISERFKDIIVPNWVKLDFSYEFYSEVDKTEHSTDTMAILHYNDKDITIVENKSCIKGKEEMVRFLK